MTAQPSLPDRAALPSRLYYLDWLRVLAIFFVFVFHAIHVFDFGGWQIKNPEQSEIITIILTLLSLWGMPFFFRVAGAASWFALQRRTPRPYLSERLQRLAIPYLVGTLLFSPLQYVLWWKNQVFLGKPGLTFAAFMRGELRPFDPGLLHAPGFSPKWIATGFHLWFIGLLFLYAVLTLPLFRWLLSEAGLRLRTAWGGLCRRRTGTPSSSWPSWPSSWPCAPSFPWSMTEPTSSSAWASSFWASSCIPARKSSLPCAGTGGSS